MAKAKKRLSIADLAQELGVSVSTISRALNNAPDVSETTKAQVWELARRLDFQTNTLAAALRSGRSNMLGVVVPHINGAFFPEVVHGIEDLASEAGFNVMICQSNEEVTREEKQIDALLKAQVDGVLVSISATTHTFGHFEKVRQQGVPLVFFDRMPDIPQVCGVVLDDYRGAYQVMEHLLAQGCRRIAHLAGPPLLNTTFQRHRAYREALLAHGLPYEPHLVVQLTESDMAAGAAAMEQLLQLPELPDAVFAAYDFPAGGVLQVLEAHQIRVPEDMAVAGFSNEPFTTMVKPQLTSVDQQARHMGETAVKLFLQMLKRTDNYVGQRIVLKPKVLVRDSSQYGRVAHQALRLTR
ncbi:LacI family DNA-binding transcriptional regulator [Hymenobacter sp. BT186]|uniref:LacI family DNA-binding transcriptional regulator n=1 Tax=Hymenobacter telluris TaxID=2816474 RepID=A0A939JCS8_9BACT|nr:LacI family DNA-binding transcriptional regulator [Hymenobacter telluris]MBO0358168.1 LacI family DNA-binding transcriptional regulator [Hymenobacter telluris]MBW3374195.1 LacI family transcriptional regulator [Hymenobacter norwichensis]